VTVLVPLAALGLDAASRAGGRRWRRPAAALAIVGIAMVASFLELTIHLQGHFRAEPTPPAYAAVERTPRGILAEYPLGYSDIYNLWQNKHGRPLFNGAPPDTPADQARLVLLDPSQAGTAQALAFLGVTTIAIHPFAHVDAEVPPHDPAPGTGFQLVERFPGNESVWKVAARAAPALVTLPGGFSKPSYVDGTVRYPLSSSAGVGVLELTAKHAGTVSLSFDAFPPGAERTLRVADDTKEQTFTFAGGKHVMVVVAVPRGRSELLLKVDPPATSGSDAVAITAPRAEGTASIPTLHARLVSTSAGF
jgi:hypothetical protein